MAIKNGDKKSKLIIGVSSRALFDLEKEDTIFKSEGLDKYIEYQRSHEDEPLKPGKAFPLIKAFTDLKVRDSEDNLAKIIIMSRNSADTGLRIFNSIEHYKLDIKQGAFVSGGDITKYLNSFNIDLFLSADEDVVKKATKCNVASGLLKYSEQEESIDLNEEIKQIKIAFDADSVIFSSESDEVYEKEGIKGFFKNEQEKANIPIQEGPFAPLVKLIYQIQKSYSSVELCPIRTALITARSAPAHKRAIMTFRKWDIRIDEVFFLGDIDKTNIIKSFGAQIFFDDSDSNIEKASKKVSSAKVFK